MKANGAIRVREMLAAIERIEGYAERGRQSFDSDYDTRELIVHHLEHLTESADQAPQSLKKANPRIPWRDLRDLRTLLVHQYMRPAPEQVWAFVRDRLPEIKRRLRAIRLDSSDD